MTIHVVFLTLLQCTSPFTYNVKCKNDLVMIKRYALHSVAIVVLSTIRFCLVDAEKCIARQRHGGLQRKLSVLPTFALSMPRGKRAELLSRTRGTCLVKQERPSRSHSAVPALGLRTQL